MSVQELLNVDKPIQTLSLVNQLLEKFHGLGIRYCHWKGNDHISDSLRGDSDLDILFDETQQAQLKWLLHGLGFKAFDAAWQKRYKDVYDFIGLDIPSGRIIHLHAYFKLRVGKLFLKPYQLDVEEKVLSSRIYKEAYGIYCADPAMELLLLYFNEALSLRHRDLVRMNFPNGMHYKGKMLQKYLWLKQQSTVLQLEAILKDLFLHYRPMLELLGGEFNRLQMKKLAVLLRKEYQHTHLYASSFAFLLRWYRELSVKISKKLSHRFHLPLISQRVNPRGGLVIALIGADGSGKSTVSAHLRKTFSEKLDVYPVYFGRGDGRMSWARKLLQSARGLLSPARSKAGLKKKNQLGFPGKRSNFLADLYRCLMALLVAYEKYRNLSLMQEARAKGMLVICDRFPQNQLMGYNDGPLLHSFSTSSNPFLRTGAKIESWIYAQAARTPPDVVFKLIAEAAVVEARKPGECTRELLERKIESIKSLHFPAPCQSVRMDAAQPLHQVLTIIKEETWKACL